MPVLPVEQLLLTLYTGMPITPRLDQPLKHAGQKHGQAETRGLHTSETKLVEDALAARRVSIAVAGHAGFHVVVVDLSIEKRLDAGLESDC